MDGMKISVPKTVLQFFYPIACKAWTDLYSLWHVRAEKYLTGFYPNSLQEVSMVADRVGSIYDNAGTNFLLLPDGEQEAFADPWKKPGGRYQNTKTGPAEY